MGVISDFYLHIDNEYKFLLIVLFIFILYFFTTVVRVTTGHFLAFIVILVVFYTMIEVNNETTEVFDHDLEYKLESLNIPDYIQKNIYIDADLIILLFNIKENFYEYNKAAYKGILKSCDNLLGIRKDFELKLVNTPSIIDLHQNFKIGSDDLLNYKLSNNDNDKKTILINAYANFTVAEEQLKLCMNELQSIIITIPSNESMHYIHAETCEKMNVLLKRNLDIIYNIYKKNKKIYDPNIVGYDSVEEYNKSTGINNITNENDIITSTFNFY